MQHKMTEIWHLYIHFFQNDIQQTFKDNHAHET